MALNAMSIPLGPWRTVRYDVPPEECAADELADMYNTRIGSGGQVEPRPGTLSYQSAAAIAGTPTVTLAAEFDATATTTYVVIAAGAKLYYYNSGWTDITGFTTITAGNDNTFEWANCNGTLAITTGVDSAAIKWTGTGDATALDVDSRFTKGKHLAWFDNRLWIGNVSGATGQLWYSNIADIETWGATSYFAFGAIITGLVATQNALTVHTSEGIYTLIATGNAVTPYVPNRRTGSNQAAPLAAVSGRAIVALPGDVQVMVCEDGIYQWSGGADLDKISYALDGGYWNTIRTSRLGQSFALFFPRENEVWFALPYGSSQTNMNHIVVFNRRTGGWHGPYGGWERNCGALVDGKPHLGGFDGILWNHDTGDDDNGTAIASWFETGSPAAIAGDVSVRWIGARCLYDGKGRYNVTATQRSTELVGASSLLDMSGAGFTLGTDILGSDVILQEVRQLSQDMSMLGYSPSCGIRISQNAVNQSYSFRKIFLRFKPLGRQLKPKPVDR